MISLVICSVTAIWVTEVLFVESMSHAPSTETSLRPAEGWHCSHLFYRFDRKVLIQLTDEEVVSGKQQFAAILDPQGDEAPARLQVSAVAGHKADFGLMLLDADPLKIDGVHQRLLASPLGPAIEPTYSFLSLTEVS